MAHSDTTPTMRYILDHLDLLQYRDYLQELFTIPDRLVVNQEGSDDYLLDTESDLYVGKLVQQGDHLWAIATFDHRRGTTYQVTLTDTGIVLPKGSVPLVVSTDPVVLEAGILVNYPEGPPLDTTIGRIILNQLILCVPFGSTIPYINNVWSTGSLEKTIGDLIIRKEITVDQVNTYITHLFFLGHASEFLCPNVSEKALTTDPHIEERKKQLLEENKEALAAGDAVAMSHIEQELIAMDRAYLKGDSSMGYYLGNKVFDTQRKKLLLTHGIVEAFGDRGHYDFIANSLEEGWTQKDFPKIANEIRAGSYSRAKSTAAGGEESKFLARVMGGVRIRIDDCQTDRTLDVLFRPDNCADYVYRNQVLPNGELDSLTIESAQTLIGHLVHLRSPLFCQAPGGYCFACFGKLFGTTDQTVFTTAASAIGAAMTTNALKKMHGSNVSTINIASLNAYVI